MARYRLKDSAGIIPALLAPFDRNGEYDPACPGELVDWLIGQDAGGFYPGPDFMVHSGPDEMMLSGRIMGADGANGSTCNVVPDLNIVAVDAFWRGDVRLAQKLMLAANAIFRIMFRHTLSPAMRAGLEFIGVPAGLGSSPAPMLYAAAKAVLRAKLRELALRLDITGAALPDAVR